MSDKHTCPRRVADGRADSDSPFRGSGPNLDTWRRLTPLGGSEKIAPKGYRSCSYCGSLHPDDFMAAVEAGDIIGPTDKSYKAYVGKPMDEVAAARVKKIIGDVAGVLPSHDYAKFSFQHLSTDQRIAFVNLINEKKINMGYPGHFYVLPFFVMRPTEG